jgi:hypothetical protein
MEPVNENITEFIEHHGVVGMKWGVRRGRTPRQTSRDYKKTAPYRKKKASELTNKQLKTANERANLEKNFRSLNPGTVAKGSAFVKMAIGAATTAGTVYALTSTPLGKATINAGKKGAKAILNKRAAKIAGKAVSTGQLKLF